MSDSVEKKEEYKASVASGLERISEIIMGSLPWSQAGIRKGVIVTDDGIHLDSAFAKEHLKYDELKRGGKVNEITVDGTWPLGDGSALRQKLESEAGKAGQGLLVVNVCDINLFRHCDILKQLVKQENIGFGGFVLMVIKGMDWEKDVRKFVEDLAGTNRAEFNAMMVDFYQLV